MTEQERLELVSAVEAENHEELDNLAESLEDVDTALRDAGSDSSDDLTVDVDLTGHESAIEDLGELQAAISAIDDDITIGVDTDFDNVLRDDVEIDNRLRGSQFRDTETGRPTSADDALDRRFRDIAGSIEDELTVTGDVSVDDDMSVSGTDSDSITAGTVDIDAGTVNVDGAIDTDDLLNGVSANNTELATSGGFPDFPDDYEPDNEEGVLPRGSASLRAYRDHNRELASVDELNVDGVRLTTSENPKTFFDAPFGQGTGATDKGRTRELINLLEDETEQFSPFDVGRRDGSDTIQMERNTGLAAEGIGGEVGAEIIEAQREAMEMRDDETLLESLDGAEKEFKDIRFTMGQFHDIIAALIPLAGIFVGALPAAITGVVALGGAALVAAGALAGIAGLGAMGLSLQQSGELSMEPLNEMFNDVGDAFVDAFAPLSMTFAPLIRDAATELETLMGPLATAASGLQMFTDEFSTLTQTTGNVLPSMVSMSLRFADAVMPVLAGIGHYLLQKDIFGFMANQLASALPQLIQLGVAFAQILPAIIRISQGFLVFATGIITALGLMSRFINAMGILAPIIGGVISLYLGLITASTIYSIVTAKAVTAIVRFAAALLVKLAPAVAKGIATLTGYTLTTWQAYAATVALIGALTLGVGAVAAMSGGFAALNSNIGDATKNLRQFAKTSNGLGSTNIGATGSGFGGGGRAGFYQNNSTTVIQAGDKDSAARQQYSSEYEHQQHVDSVFGG